MTTANKVVLGLQKDFAAIAISKEFTAFSFKEKGSNNSATISRPANGLATQKAIYGYANQTIHLNPILSNNFCLKDSSRLPVVIDTDEQIAVEVEKSDLSNLTDPQIISAIKEVPSLFWDLWLLYQNRIFRYAYKLTNNHHDAEDLCSATMLKAFHNIQNVSSNVHINGWLYQIARNLFFDTFRRKKTMTKYLDYEKSAMQEQADQKLKINDLINEETKTFIIDEINNLPSSYRSIATAYFIKEKKYKQISLEGNRSEDYLRKIIFRARKRLAPKIKEYMNAHNFHPDNVK